MLLIWITNIGWSTKTKMSFYLYICPFCFSFLSKISLTLMRSVYPRCLRPKLTFSCFGDRCPLESTEAGRDLVMSLNVNIGLLKESIWSLSDGWNAAGLTALEGGGLSLVSMLCIDFLIFKKKESKKIHVSYRDYSGDVQTGQSKD